MRSLLILLGITSCAQVAVVDRSQNTYWHDLVRKMQTEQKSLISILEQSHPLLLKQMTADTTDPLLLSFWGESVNFDSAAKKQIVDDRILNELQDLFKLKSDNYVVHAGVIHSYGYLFSNLETPYGYKRKRWIDPEVNRAFNLSGFGLSPETTSGTLLSNLTYFAGRIAFQNASTVKKLDELKNVSHEIKNFSYTNLKVKVLQEKIQTPSNIKKALRTHFVQFPQKGTSDQNAYLLVYSLEDLVSHTEKLITAFPITKDAFLKTTDPILMGEDRPIQAKYNVHLSIEKDVRMSGFKEIKDQIIR